MLCAFDLIELDGEDLRRSSIEYRKRKLAKLLRRPELGIVLNEHYEGDGEIIFKHACKLGCEGIVSKRARLTVSLWALVALGEGQKPDCARCEARRRGGLGALTFLAPPTRPLFVITGADEVTVLPLAIRAWKSESLSGKNHSYREGDTHQKRLHG